MTLVSIGPFWCDRCDKLCSYLQTGEYIATYGVWENIPKMEVIALLVINMPVLKIYHQGSFLSEKNAKY